MAERTGSETLISLNYSDSILRDKKHLEQKIYSAASLGAIGMFFHIDESGNTGNNLFDSAQPRLSYGMLSSRTNVDALGLPLHGQMLSMLGVETLHAAELGMGKIETISPLLLRLQEKMHFEFDYYFIDKAAYALVQLFEAVYDAGLNDAVAWFHYWTPMRFHLIGLLGQIIDEDILRRAWSLCSDKRIGEKYCEVTLLLQDIKARIASSDFDVRTKEFLSDPLDYGIANPQKLDFGTADPKIISPNAVAFQFVVSAMSRRLRKKDVSRATAVTIDHQQQFNIAQLRTQETQRLIAEGLKKSKPADQAFILNHPLYAHLSRNELLDRRIPREAPVVSRSAQSVGLQIVDIYLWLTTRMMSGARLSPGAHELARGYLMKAYYDGISMEGMMSRWQRFERELPRFEDLTEAQLVNAQKMVTSHRAKVAALEL